MHLTSREQEKLMLFLAGELAADHARTGDRPAKPDFDNADALSLDTVHSGADTGIALRIGLAAVHRLVAQPVEEIGRKAAELLVRRISTSSQDGEAPKPQAVRLRPTQVFRDFCGCRR